jgi:hypothetical protein
MTPSTKGLRICFDDDGILVQPNTNTMKAFVVFALTGILALSGIGFAHLVEKFL